MVHKHSSDDDFVDPAYAGRLSHVPIPKNRMADAHLEQFPPAHPALQPGFSHAWSAVAAEEVEAVA